MQRFIIFLSEFWKELIIYLWSSSTFLTASWCWRLCKPRLVELYYRFTDLSRDLKMRTAIKIKNSYKKWWEFWSFFVNFQLNQIQNCSVQINKVEDRIFHFQLKTHYFFRILTEDARHKNVPPPFGLNRMFKSYHKRNEEIPGKIGATDITWNKSHCLIGQKLQNTFQ